MRAFKCNIIIKGIHFTVEQLKKGPRGAAAVDITIQRRQNNLIRSVSY
jgi:hypothetical protein